jgi:hypothetical protein
MSLIPFYRPFSLSTLAAFQQAIYPILLVFIYPSIKNDVVIIAMFPELKIAFVSSLWEKQ